MKEGNPSKRRTSILKFFRELPSQDDDGQVLPISGLWNTAMAHPNDPEFIELGIFECMAALIWKGLKNRRWLSHDQNIYIPYYAAHIIGSYTMNMEEFAESSVHAGVIPPLIELLRGRLTWVEQRVAVRALGHLATYPSTFPAIASHGEILELSIQLAMSSLEIVYSHFYQYVDRRLSYHCDLLTRGMGGVEMESRKAEEWASQLQCWSLQLINSYAFKPLGRGPVASCPGIIEALCNIARSSDDWQYMAIECLLWLIQDPSTCHKSVLQECVQSHGSEDLTSSRVKETIEELLKSKQRLKWEKSIAKEDLHIKQAAGLVVKLEGNSLFSSGNITGAVSKYTEALDLCPVRSKKERVVLYSNRAQCYLLLQQPQAAISDATRALCLHSPLNRHAKSLWRRAQAYDMLGLAKESLLDAILFINECSQSQNKVPDYAERLVKKQMRTAWLFREAAIKHGGVQCEGDSHAIYGQESDGSEWETASESDIGNDGRDEVGGDDEEDEDEWRNEDKRKGKYDRPPFKGTIQHIHSVCCDSG
ncbi:Tetratricopeptide repeat protein 1 [Linum perenne]